MFQLDESSILSAVQDIQKLVSDSKELGKEAYAFNAFQAKNEDFKLAAVDGSNQHIKGVNFAIALLRAGYQIYRKEEMVEESISPVVMEMVANNDDLKIGYAVKFERYYQTVTGELPEKYPAEFEKVPEKLRTLMEWEIVKKLVDKLESGDVIIFDGALISGTITTNHYFVNTLLEKAKSKGISLVGLSKDTSLSIGAAPAPMVLLESAAKHHPGKNWYVEYKPGVYFVRFRKHKELVFRCDIAHPEDASAEEILSKVADYCFDFAVAGYPYPMQTIHDAVRIDNRQREGCLEDLRDACLKAKMPMETFESLFSIYHDALDTISFGR